MRWLGWLGTLLLVPLLPAPATAWGGAGCLDRLNQRLAGHLVDYTHNHGADRRIWSPTLEQWRDLYVYLPPGFDPGRLYPVLIWLHGILEDERALPHEGALEAFDAAIAAGRLPPLIIVMPDGNVRGSPTLYGINTHWINSQVGPFQDYLLHDIWGFVREHYPIRPEREAHVLGGFSGGGGASFRIATLFRKEFGVCMAFHPNLNVRWSDCHGRYRAPFDPCCWGWRTAVPRCEVVARFYGVIVVRLGPMVYPLFGRGPEAVAGLSSVNPIELIDREHLREGELAMYVAYGGRDQFNITAQVESFLYRARQLGLSVTVDYDPDGTHSWHTARPMLPGMIDWLGQVLKPFGPLEPGCPPRPPGPAPVLKTTP
jgi:S-formylglutathione hydrolase FrmB